MVTNVSIRLKACVEHCNGVALDLRVLITQMGQRINELYKNRLEPRTKSKRVENIAKLSTRGAATLGRASKGILDKLDGLGNGNDYDLSDALQIPLLI